MVKNAAIAAVLRIPNVIPYPLLPVLAPSRARVCARSGALGKPHAGNAGLVWNIPML
jgi:hypothetical protein